MNPRADHPQAMGYWLNEPAILDHRRITAAMADLAAAGYGIVRVIIRQTCFAHRSPEVIAAVRTATAAAHAGGMRLVLDCEPHALLGRELGRAHPRAVGLRLFRASGPLRGGAFRVDFQLEAMDGIIFDHVAGAAVDGVPMPVPGFSLDWETTTAPEGIADARQDYVAGRAMRMRRHLRLDGRIPGAADGSVTLHVACREPGLVDFAAPEVRTWYRGLLDDYRGIPLDGVCWDEPAVAGDWRSYRYGHAFARRFRADHGYDLAGRLALLDAPGLDPAAVRVRLDYYRTLEDCLAEAQADLVAAAAERFGDGLLLGNHHTWQGEGGINDYRAGAVDYFRLTDAMDAGYSDCCWWDQASCAYSYVLAASLARLTPSRVAECNSWHWKPTNRAIAYNARLMSLLRITWFNIWYGDDADTCMYPAHRTWPATVAAMRRHRGWLRLLGDARPLADVAVLHDWRGVCGSNLVHAANLHKAFCLNFAHAAVHGNLAFDFIDARLLAGAAVAGGLLATGIGRYRVLVVPGAAVLPRAAWERIAAFAAGGGRVVFAGPPPSVDSDGGDLTAAFAGLLGMEPLHADAYDAWFAAACPELPQGRPERFDLAYPVTGDAARLLLSSEDEPHGIAAPGGAVAWYSGYEASAAVLAQCRRWTGPAVRCHSGSVLWRLYRDRDRTLLMLAAREDAELSGIIEHAGRTLRLDGGDCACLEMPDAGEDRLHRDPPSAQRRSALADPAASADAALPGSPTAATWEPAEAGCRNPLRRGLAAG